MEIDDRRSTRKVYKIDSLEENRCAAALIEFLDTLALQPHAPEGLRYRAFLKQAIRAQLAGKHQMAVSSGKKDGESGSFSEWSMREPAMANNIIWLLDSFLIGKKAIILASGLHVSRNLASIEPRPVEFDSGFRSMGDYLFDHYGDSYAAFGFLTYSGNSGLVRGGLPLLNEPVLPPPPGSLEMWLHNAGHSYSFFSFRTLRSSNKQISFPMFPTFTSYHSALWATMYDGVFFIDKMEPIQMIWMQNRMLLTNPYNFPIEWVR